MVEILPVLNRTTDSFADCYSFLIYIDGLVQGRHNSSALAMELHLSCINPLICGNANPYSEITWALMHLKSWKTQLFVEKLVQVNNKEIIKSSLYCPVAGEFPTQRASNTESILSLQGCMMMSSNGNIFHGTGPLRGESTSHQWIPLTKVSDAELWCFLWSATEQTVEQTIQMPVIWDTTGFIMTSL